MNKNFINAMIKQKKVYILYLIIFISFFVATIIIVQSNYFITYNMIPSIESKYQNREIFISSSKNISYIEGISMIDGIEEIELTQLYMNSKTVYIENITNSSISLNSGLINHIPNILYGRCVDEKRFNEIVLPNYLDIGGKKESTLEFLNKEIVISFLDETQSNKTLVLNVVGIYDVEVIESFNKAYISDKNVLDFKNNDVVEYLAIVNKTENVKNVISKLELLGFDSNLFDDSLQNELQVYTSLLKVSSVFFNIIIMLCIGIICFLTSDLINMNINTIAIMKAVGYKELDVIKNIFVIMVVISTISYLISMILISMTLFFLNTILSISLTINHIFSILLYLIYLIVALIIELFFIIRIKKISIIDLLNSK